MAKRKGLAGRDDLKMVRPPKGARMDRFRGVPYTTEEYLAGKVDEEAVGCVPCSTCPGLRAMDEPCATCSLLVQRGQDAKRQEEEPDRYACCENPVPVGGPDTCPDCAPEEETFMEAQDRIVDRARRRDFPAGEAAPCGMPKATHSKDCPKCSGEGGA